jgi:hypothetical protein
MPRIVRFYIRCVAIGLLVSAIFTGLVILFDVAHLRHLFSTSDVGLLAVFLFWFFNGIVFTGVQAVWGVMQMAEDK